MCRNCVITERISSKGAIAHIGYGKNNKNKYDKLITDDIVIETSKSKKKLSQEDYFTLWDKLKQKDNFGNIDPNLPQKNNSACAVCREYLITVPAVKYHGSGDPVASVFSPAPQTQRILIPLALGLRLVSL